MKNSSSHFPSLLSAILFSLGALLLLGIALLMGLVALSTLLNGTGIRAEQTIFLIAFSFEGLILLAAAFFAFQKFLQRPSADREVSIPIPTWLIVVSIIVAGIAILIGYAVGTLPRINWLVLPVLTIPAIVLPLVVLLALGTKKLPFGTRWQTWDILGLAMTLSPLVLFTLEILVAIVILVLVAAYVLTQPELASRLQALSRQIMTLGPNSKATFDLLSPFLTQPGVIVTSLIYIAVLVPAIEEIFKPLGVWLFAGKLQSQAQGFALGALSGAGYALIETVGVSGQATDWASVLLSRIGTGLLHITTSALMGAAIVLAWRERRYARLIATYSLAILLHGLWNATATLFTFSSLAEQLHQGGFLSTLQPTLAIMMIILAIGLFMILVLSNRKMQKTIPPAPAEIIPPNEK